ncbi:ribosomal protein L29 [Roseimicrobium gellanilyticum]|uniref:Large ribosomal subunit protein uL29 n=1 Tax=Roseimicrobium gellanilyticum TaxID=748857 RepID=A0A366HW01_9BACT|nr:50S ribosomal protein L29 [Roseimicrobium gellanilyticum]RBP47879.1 ribosomal protein L29 [Roseimicrobium gellanilyticum]
MKVQELRELTNEEIAVRRREARQELLHLSVQQASGQVENTGRFRQIKRGIAQMETILSERRLNIVVTSGPKKEKKAKAEAPAADKPAAKKAAKKAVKKAAKKAE